MQENIDKAKHRETQRHNVNTEIANTRSINVQETYNDRRISLDRAKIDLEEYKVNNAIEHNNNMLELQRDELARKGHLDSVNNQFKAAELGLQTVEEARKITNDFLGFVNPIYGLTNNIRGGMNNGQKKQKKR
jgi:hypothetical protein